MKYVLLAHLAATLFMVGVVWFVQVVHYPLFAQTGAADFTAYERRHVSLTTRVVAPPMLVEALTAVLLLRFRPAGMSNVQCGLGLALLAVVWLSTWLVQVPSHELLSRGFEPEAHRRLVAFNGVRTAAWTLRGGLVLWAASSVWK